MRLTLDEMISERTRKLLFLLTFSSEKKMSNDAIEFRKKAKNAKTDEDRQYFEQKATAIEDRAAATSDVAAMERVLKETETIFDELEEQLQRMKQSKVLIPLKMGTLGYLTTLLKNDTVRFQNWCPWIKLHRLYS